MQKRMSTVFSYEKPFNIERNLPKMDHEYAKMKINNLVQQMDGNKIEQVMTPTKKNFIKGQAYVPLEDYDPESQLLNKKLKFVPNTSFIIKRHKKVRTNTSSKQIDLNGVLEEKTRLQY